LISKINGSRSAHFTAFSDTAQYLYNALKDDLIEFGVHCGLVTGSKCDATIGAKNFNDVLMNFTCLQKTQWF
jgi:hypothetical protein